MSIEARIDSILKPETGGTNHVAAGSGFCRKDLTGKGVGASERISVRIVQFLANHKPEVFCDGCIAEKLGLSHRHRVTAILCVKAAVWRDVGACSQCGKHKQVIRHV
jgi:hypothetical protein